MFYTILGGLRILTDMFGSVMISFEVWEPCKFVMVQNAIVDETHEMKVWEPCKFVMVQNVNGQFIDSIMVWEPCKFVMVQNKYLPPTFTSVFENLVSL